MNDACFHVEYSLDRVDYTEFSVSPISLGIIGIVWMLQKDFIKQLSE
tara:strand:- start:2174 stop:2314 length:141 start_codon:yes stop_codon:yes gene_type:complete